MAPRKPSAPKNKKNKRSERSTLSWKCRHCHLRFTTSIDDLISHELHCPNQLKNEAAKKRKKTSNKDKRSKAN